MEQNNIIAHQYMSPAAFVSVKPSLRQITDRVGYSVMCRLPSLSYKCIPKHHISLLFTNTKFLHRKFQLIRSNIFTKIKYCHNNQTKTTQ